MLIFEAACPIFYDVVFTLSQHEKPCAIKKASSFNAFKRRLCLHGCSITGESLNPDYFLTYLEEKFSALYELP